jgi:hypothetical protein
LTYKVLSDLPVLFYEIASEIDSILEYFKKEGKKLTKPEDLAGFLFLQSFTKVEHLVEAKTYSENTAR